MTDGLNARLAAARENYARGGLSEQEAGPDPFALFSRWYDEASASGIVEPNAMVVATASAQAAPSARTVLLKGADERGFVFFTNTASRKGSDLAANPRAALLFGWHQIERQVRIEGAAELVGADEVAAYFAQRPRGSQIGAHASHQSHPVADRAALEAAYAEAERRFGDGPVPVPVDWGGYRVHPSSYEFWQGRPGRMHDRIRFDLVEKAWRRSRLAP